MYQLTKRVMFCAAHSIKGGGKCENKHGHNWEANIKVTLINGSLDSRGFIADVGDIKDAAFKYDHDDLDKYFDYPSTENVAKKIAEDALQICVDSNPDSQFLVDVHLIETENNTASAKADNVASTSNQDITYFADGLDPHNIRLVPPETTNKVKRIV